MIFEDKFILFFCFSVAPTDFICEKLTIIPYHMISQVDFLKVLWAHIFSWPQYTLLCNFCIQLVTYIVDMTVGSVGCGFQTLKWLFGQKSAG